ncbi:hypothetical protein ASG17_07220 [Brevundimonas sp. Leaf363]|nr:hypothetical protein ASG17_07220 [Brevundimonas sp. Leaf363]
MVTALWDWAIAAYRDEETARLCLELQERHGQQVCLTLWAAWAAGRGYVDDETVEAAVDIARAWETATLSPLRAVRRTLKKPVPDMADEPRLSVRDRIKGVELAAERALLDALATEAAPTPGPATDSVALMVRAARLWGETTPRPTLVSLAQRLPA